MSFFPCKRLNSGPIFIHFGCLILCFKTLRYWPYFYKHWNCDLILERWNSGSIFILIGILILPLQMILLFYPYFYRHRNSDLILPNIGIQNSIIVILAFFFQTLEFLSHSFTANIEILAPAFEKCEFWFVFFKTSQFLSYPFKH